MVSCEAMSLDPHVPVLMKKTQMNGESGGSQCGLTSLLPMACRDRAAAFARDLHSRLRNLGTDQDDDGEGSWLARNNNHQPTSSTGQRDIDTFYDFELVCESPSSPVEEYEPTYQRSPVDEKDPPCFDINSEPETKEQAKPLLQQSDKSRNGFKFSTTFYIDPRPVKLQPVPRENGHTDRLFSPITFEGCVRQNSVDEVDNVVLSSITSDIECANLLSAHANLSTTTVDSDSEFESAKSDPSDCADEVFQSEEVRSIEATENLSLTDIEILTEESDNIKKPSVDIEIRQNECDIIQIITTDTSIEKESSPEFENESTLLGAKTEIEDIDEDDRPQRVRRCSSLKTGKTPPGTPGRKKIVRFADVLGLDLADVKTFMDEIPVIPKSAYDDLTECDVQNSPPIRTMPRAGALTLVPLFQLPRDFTEKLEKQNVCLENARVCDGVHVTICGSVRVRNLDFHKTVHIRYTMNRWKTYTDLQTTYVQGSCDGFSDRFQFILYTPCITSGQRLELAVRFQCKGQQLWDNNNGANYCFDCLALGASLPVPPSSGPLHPTIDWHPSFY